jgi:hypothetical protein
MWVVEEVRHSDVKRVEMKVGEGREVEQKFV